MPDHWVPVAVAARAHRWSLARTARVTLWVAVGHVAGSLLLALLVAALGLGATSLVAVQGHVVGAIFLATGLGFLLWAVFRKRRGVRRPHDHPHAQVLAAADGGAGGGVSRRHAPPGQGRSAWSASLAIPFGVAASPDLTVLPVALAASTLGLAAVIGAIVVFSLVTVLTFFVLTLGATLGGYQVEWPWLEEHAEVVSAFLLIGLGILAYLAA